MDLLLEADPSREKIEGYLPRSRCFVATLDGAPAGVYVVLETAPAEYELMNIAVAPHLQGKGIGTTLLRHAIATVRELGARRLEVGTGTFGHQLAYYQREGFRVSRVDRDFFLENYPEPIYENGIQHKDMLRLVLEYR
ncbi:GNAT family N-acetyltransferase [Zestomonas carbonaria]|nr:GNAT family N-acetyltransferase [Pseudomonas carbonaria]